MNTVDEGALSFQALIETDDFKKSIAAMIGDVNRLSKESVNEAKRMDAAFKKLSVALGGYFTFTQAKAFVAELVSIRSQFQQLEIAFGTMLGSKQKADVLMKELITFAGTTPFGLKETAEASKMLLAYGSSAEGVTAELRMLGDVASGVGAPIKDIVYLYGTLRTQGRAYLMDIRQFAGRGIPIYEQLAKVLKVGKDEVNALVTAGRVGFPEIEQAFKNMTAEGSVFGGLMDAQSKSFAGQLERIGDAVDSVLNDLGKANEGLITGGLNSVAFLVENYQTLIEILGVSITVYGAYRTALLLTTALESARAAGLTTMTARQLLATGATKVAAIATAAYNAVLAASPIGAATIAITALAGAIYGLSQLQSGAEMAQEAVTKAQVEGLKSAEAERKKIEELTTVIKDKNATDEQRASAYDKLVAQTGDVLKGYNQEAIATGKATVSLNEYINSLARAIEVRSAFDQYQKLIEQETEIKAGGYDNLSMLTKAGRGIKNTFVKSDAVSWGEYFGGLFDGNKAKENIIKDMLLPIEQAKAEIMKKYKSEFTEIITGVSKSANDAGGGVATLTVGKKLAEINKEIEASKSELKKLTSDNAVYDAKKIDSIREKLQELEKEKEAITGISKKGSESAANKAIEKYNKALEDQADILDEVTKRRNEYAASQKGEEESDKNRVKEYFDDIRKKVEEFNKKAPATLKFDGEFNKGLDKMQAQEEYAISETFDTKKLMEDLAKQKVLFNDYEEYKKQTSEALANERYSAELDIIKAFNQRVVNERNKLEDIKPEDRTEQQRERLKELLKFETELNREIQSKKDDAFTEAYNAAKSYEIDRAKLIEQSNKHIAELSAKGETKKAEAIKKETEKTLKDMDRDFIESDKSFKVISETLNELTTKAGRDAIKAFSSFFEDFISKSDLSGEAIDELKKKYGKFVKSANENVTKATQNGILEMVRGFDDLVNYATQFDGTLSSALKTIGSMISVTAEIADAFKNLGKATASTGGSVGAILGAVLGVVGSVISIFEAKSKKRQQQEQERQKYAHNYEMAQYNAITSALKEQLNIIKDIYGTQRVKEYAKILEDSSKAFQENLGKVSGRTTKFTFSGQKELDDIINKYNNFVTQPDRGNSKIPGTGNDLKNVYYRQIQEAIKNGANVEMLDLSFKSIKDATRKQMAALKNLIESEKLDETTKTVVSNLIEQWELYRDALLAFQEELTGISFNSLTSEIQQMFANGEISAEQFGKKFEDIMKKSIMQSFQRKFLEDQLADFYDSFASASESGDNLTKEEIAELKKTYQTIIDNAKKGFDDLKDISGIDFASGGEGSALAGAIQREITEQTASELSGILRSMFDIMKRMHDFDIASRQHAVDQSDILRNSLLELRQIRDNTQSLSDKTSEVLAALKSIEANTKGDQTSRDLGL